MSSFYVQLEQEIDLILGKKDVVRNSVTEWSSKWSPAILAYVQGVRGKAAQSAIEDAEKKYKSKSKYFAMY